jgi:hypothetical protein
VKSFSESFPDARYAALVVEYDGVNGRIIRDAARGSYYSVNRKSAVASRRSKTVVRLDTLGERQIAEAAAGLTSPIFRLFEGWELSTEFAFQRLKAKD